MIAIVDYGMGNLRSVEKALQKTGAEVIITPHATLIDRATKIVLPGVGAFPAAMRNLESAGLIQPLLQAIQSGKPFLGICLGLQLLFEEGLEMGFHKGLGVLQGRVVRFPQQVGLRVPHMGWNRIEILKPAPYLAGLNNEDMFYFVHSYYADPADTSLIAARTHHGIAFASCVWQDNVFATQFHPEKSGKVGLRLLQNFANL